MLGNLIMEEINSWITVVDNAVKIGLGALLGGGFGVWVAWLNNKSQSKKDYHERRRTILEEVLESVDSSSNTASMHWANLINAVYLKEENGKISDSNSQDLEKLENEFFESFLYLY